MHRPTGSINRVLWNNSSSDKKANECDLKSRSAIERVKSRNVNFSGCLRYMNVSGSLGLKKYRHQIIIVLNGPKVEVGEETCAMDLLLG